jgi:hypothetical protein
MQGGHLESVQQDAHMQCGLLDLHHYETSEMWAWPESNGTIFTNATGRCAVKNSSC